MSGSLCCSQPAPPFSSCRLLTPALPVTQPNQLHPPANKSNHDWLEVMEGRRMQDSSV